MTMVLLAATPVLAEGVAAPLEPVEFNRDIRPILSEHCFTCHGPDGRKLQAGLRLDLESSARSELETGARAVVAGKPDESELLVRVVATDPAERMPPPETGKPLSAQQIELLRRWITEGAPWDGHWSFQPIGRPVPPHDDDPACAGFVRNPIDAFVARGLARQQLGPAPEADRVTLLRRVYSDLIGLPPTSAEVAEFLADAASDAYEKVVDRLLASPHFGERLAIVWLDLVRYADSAGLYADQSVRVSPYRDYVIGAFNANMPFDQFTIEQLAGDLIPSSTTEQRVASAYNRLGRMSTESGVQEKEYLAKYIGERVRNAGTTWLGITLGCCECHDHKYDPLATRDFYRLAAYFADIKERGVYDRDSPVGIDWGPNMSLGTPAQMAGMSRLKQEFCELTEKADRHKSDHVKASPEQALEQSRWEASLFPPQGWKKLRPIKVTAASGAFCRVLPDRSILINGQAETDTFTVRAHSPLRRITALRLETLTDASLPGQGPGCGESGNFILTGLSMKVAKRGAPAGTDAPFRFASATYAQPDLSTDGRLNAWTPLAAIRPDPAHPERGWSIADRSGVAQHAIFETEADVRCGPDSELTIVLRHQHGKRMTLGRFRLSVAEAERPVMVFGHGMPVRVQEALRERADRRTEGQARELAEYYAMNVTPAGKELSAQLERVQSKLRSLDLEMDSVLTTVSVEPRPIRVLKRGNWQDDSGEIVEPGIPAALPQPPPTAGRGTRLDLARWIVAAENPLTARVLVNRLWKIYFGAALSRKVDDLGSQGEWPTHPELLDYLAGGLIDSGWNLKDTIRRIVTSGTYRQSSVASAVARERDPENRWLSHQGRFRLEAELVRDNALAVSGLLARKIGGPSVFPYQPAGYLDLLDKPPRVWTESAGAGIYRRGLYTHWQRQFLHPMLSAFDAPSREECAAERSRSNTPMQALVLLNDPTFVEAARALAQGALREGGATAGERAGWLYRTVLSTPPRDSEREILVALAERQQQAYARNPDAARALLSVGRLGGAEDCDEIEVATWTNVARVVLNLHDTVMRK
jgi:mono/diheme cytochrome c family protein